MPSIHVAPHTPKVPVTRRGSFSVPRDVATINCDCAFSVPCDGIALNALSQEHRALEIVARARAKTMVARLALRGQELKGQLWLHGPWASYLFEERLSDPDMSAFEQARVQRRPDGQVYEDTSVLLPMVFERDMAIPVSDYLLVGKFVMNEVVFDEPVILKGGPHGQ